MHTACTQLRCTASRGSHSIRRHAFHPAALTASVAMLSLFLRRCKARDESSHLDLWCSAIRSWLGRSPQSLAWARERRWRWRATLKGGEAVNGVSSHEWRCEQVVATLKGSELVGAATYTRTPLA